MLRQCYKNNLWEVLLKLIHLLITILLFMQLSRTKGNIWKLPSLALFFQIATFFLNATSLSEKVKMFSSLPCMLVLRLLRCANVSAKYSSLESQNSHWRYSHKRSCFSVLKNACSSLRSSSTVPRIESLPPIDSALYWQKSAECNFKNSTWLILISISSAEHLMTSGGAAVCRGT